MGPIAPTEFFFFFFFKGGKKQGYLNLRELKYLYSCAHGLFFCEVDYENLFERLDPIAILKVVLKDKTHLNIDRFS